MTCAHQFNLFDEENTFWIQCRHCGVRKGGTLNKPVDVLGLPFASTHPFFLVVLEAKETLYPLFVQAKDQETGIRLACAELRESKGVEDTVLCHVETFDNLFAYFRVLVV